MTHAKRWLPILGALLLTAGLVGLARMRGGELEPVEATEEAGGEGEAEGVSADPEEAPGEDQYALLRSILEAEEVDESGAFARTRAAWTGRRVRWEMMRLGRLCSSPERCFVSPFDYNRLDPGVNQGFLPELSMDAAQHRAMSQACVRHEPCVVRFEGVLDRFVFSLELPTRVHVSEVRFLEARGVGEGERWFRRHVVPAGLAEAAARRRAATAAGDGGVRSAEAAAEEEDKPAGQE